MVRRFRRALAMHKENPILLLKVRLPGSTEKKENGKWIVRVQLIPNGTANNHIVFAPKYRRQMIYGRLRTEIGKILRELCKRKEIEILEAEAGLDHIHVLLSIPPKYSVSSVMGYLKGKSSLMIFDRFANLKYKYGNREFWCRGYYVDTVGRNKAAIEKYIRNQLVEDRNEEQLVMKELFDPFTGEPAKKDK